MLAWNDRYERRWVMLDLLAVPVARVVLGRERFEPIRYLESTWRANACLSHHIFNDLYMM
jgi:hypothetical protein